MKILNFVFLVFLSLITEILLFPPSHPSLLISVMGGDISIFDYIKDGYILTDLFVIISFLILARAGRDSALIERKKAEDTKVIKE